MNLKSFLSLLIPVMAIPFLRANGFLPAWIAVGRDSAVSTWVQWSLAEPERFSWIGRAGLICLRKSFVFCSLRASYRPAPRSLLGLQRHLLRNHFPPNLIVPAEGTDAALKH